MTFTLITCQMEIATIMKSRAFPSIFRSLHPLWSSLCYKNENWEEATCDLCDMLKTQNVRLQKYLYLTSIPTVCIKRIYFEITKIKLTRHNRIFSNLQSSWVNFHGNLSKFQDQIHSICPKMTNTAYNFKLKVSKKREKKREKKSTQLPVHENKQT